jgi:CheY-like chemotaxis protein
MASPPKSILFIDDNKDLLSLMHLSLEAKGFNVLIASNGPEGLHIVASQPVDLVIVDYKMPEMDGEAVAHAVRRMRPLMPIIMYSGALEDIPSRVLELVDEFISKQEPFTNLLHQIPRVVVRRDRPRRGSPRYRIRLPFVVWEGEATSRQVLYGETSDLGEGGIGGMVEGDLPLSEAVRLHLMFGNAALQTRGTVRHRSGQFYGFQFLDLTPEQRETIKRSLIN